MLTPGAGYGSRTLADLKAAVAAIAEPPFSLISTQVARDVLTVADKTGKDPVDLLFAHPKMKTPRNKILGAIANHFRIQFHDFQSRNRELKESPDLFESVNFSHLKRHTAFPLVGNDGALWVTAADPFNTQMVEYMASMFPESDLRSDTPRLALSPVDQVVGRLLELESSQQIMTIGQEMANTRSRTPAKTVTSKVGPMSAARGNVATLTDSLMQQAVAKRASDIHLSFTEAGRLVVKFRVDGVLVDQGWSLPNEQANQMVTSLLNKCGTIDASNKRIPQNGTFNMEIIGRRIDTRVATVPTTNGLLVVIRLLDRGNVRAKLEDVGLRADVIAVLRSVSLESQGLVLVTGPTGSGKTTTLYSVLNEVDRDSRHVVSAEDPVEYDLDGVNQVQIRGGLGEKSFTFAMALRAFLRADPDVMLIGEIRDEETAEVSMHAAQTGHLVFSTLHTNSALEVVERLREMHVSGSIIANTLSLALGQRLLRQLHECKVLEGPTDEEIEILREYGFTAPERVYHARGCAGCSGSGYFGRIVVVEMLRPNAVVRRALKDDVPASDVRRIAIQEGFQSMAQDAYARVLEGVTTVNEMRRAVGKDEVETAPEPSEETTHG